jgi:hypothetical protein
MRRRPEGSLSNHAGEAIALVTLLGAPSLSCETPTAAVISLSPKTNSRSPSCDFGRSIALLSFDGSFG